MYVCNIIAYKEITSNYKPHQKKKERRKGDKQKKEEWDLNSYLINDCIYQIVQIYSRSKWAQLH